MDDDRIQSIKRRILALSSKTVERGCTEAEAFRAAEMVARLLEEYNLSLNEVNLKEESFIEKEWKRPPGVVGKMNDENFIYALANFTDCLVWRNVHAVVKSGKIWKEIEGYSFFGLEPDAEMALYLFVTIKGAIRTEVESFYISSGNKRSKSMTTSFLHGICGRIRIRLNEMTAKKNEHLFKVEKTTGRNLVLLKKAALEDASPKDLTTSKTKARMKDADAFIAGDEAGKKINLSQPLEEAPGRPLLLTKR